MITRAFGAPAAQLLRFGAVGGAATVVHFIVAVLAVESAGLLPLLANMLAFICAFPVSFVGHLYWTFRGQTDGHGSQDRRAYWLRFFATAIVGLLISQSVVFVVADLLSIHHRIAFASAVVLAPLSVFVLSKYWVFRAPV